MIPILLAALMIVISLPNTSIVAAAENGNQVMNATATVDGVIDMNYKKSASYSLTGPSFYAWGEVTTEDIAGTAYFLWDTDYLYVAVEVADSTPVSAGEGAGWMNDAAEIWYVDPGFNTYKFHSSGDGNFFAETGDPGFTMDEVQKVAVKTETGYIVEYALPMTGLELGAEIAYSLQLNDVIAEDLSSGYAVGSQAAENTLYLAEGPVTAIVNATPKVDGVIDGVYKKSVNTSVSGPSFYAWGEVEKEDIFGTAYFLWDADYLYVAAEVFDSTPVSAGEGAGWMNDAVEIWYVDPGFNTYKFHSSGDGNFFAEPGDPGFTMDVVQKIAVQTETGYIVEYALPMAGLEADAVINLSLQINDVLTADLSSGYAVGSQAMELEYTLAAGAGNEIANGTPTVDAEIDDIYKESAYVMTSTPSFYAWGEVAKEDIFGTAYFLWDADYLYVAVEVADSTPVSAGEGAGWMNDAVEIWYVDPEFNTYKFHSAADGNIFAEVGDPGFTMDQVQKATAMTSKGYIVEYALPMAGLEADAVINLSVQLNDVLTEDLSAGYAVGSQAMELEMILVGGEEAPAEESTPADVVVEEPAAESNSVVLYVVIAAVVIIGAVVLVVLKKKKNA